MMVTEIERREARWWLEAWEPVGLIEDDEDPKELAQLLLQVPEDGRPNPPSVEAVAAALEDIREEAAESVSSRDEVVGDKVVEVWG